MDPIQRKKHEYMYCRFICRMKTKVEINLFRDFNDKHGILKYNIFLVYIIYAKVKSINKERK